MTFFKEVDGEAAVLVENGVYKQVPIYTRNGFLFAKVSGGFVRLMADGSTSKSKMRLDYMSWEGRLMRDGVGRLCTDEATGAKELDPARVQALIGAPL